MITSPERLRRYAARRGRAQHIRHETSNVMPFLFPPHAGCHPSISCSTTRRRRQIPPFGVSVPCSLGEIGMGARVSRANTHSPRSVNHLLAASFATPHLPCCRSVTRSRIDEVAWTIFDHSLRARGPRNAFASIGGLFSNCQRFERCRRWMGSHPVRVGNVGAHGFHRLPSPKRCYSESLAKRKTRGAKRGEILRSSRSRHCRCDHDDEDGGVCSDTRHLKTRSLSGF